MAQNVDDNNQVETNSIGFLVLPKLASDLQLLELLTSKNPARRLKKRQQWLSLPIGIRNFVKETMYNKLHGENLNSDIVAQCTAAIACAELTVNNWPNLIQDLIRNSKYSNVITELKVASLNTIGYICKDISPGVLDQYSSEILDCIYHGISNQESNNYVKLAALKALIKSLRIFSGIFEKHSCTSHLIERILNLTKQSKRKIKIACLSCLSKIATLQFKCLYPMKIPEVNEVIISAMQSCVCLVRHKGVQLLACICIKGKQLQEEDKDLIQTPFFAKDDVVLLVSLLLETLSVQFDADQNTDQNTNSCTWVCMIARNCFSFLAQYFCDCATHYIIKFVSFNITAADWRRKYAVIFVFDVLCSAIPTKIKPIFDIVIPHIPVLIQNDHELLKQATVASVNKISDVLQKIVLGESQLNILTNLFIQCFRPASDVKTAVAVCKLIRSLSHQTKGTCLDVLQLNYDVIVRKLLEVIVTTNPAKNKIRKYACMTFDYVIVNCPEVCYDNMLEVLDVVLNAIQGVCNAVLVLPILNSILKKMKPSDVCCKQLEIMNGCLRILNLDIDDGKREKLVLQTFRTIGIFVEKAGNQFSRCLNYFKNELLQGLMQNESKKIFNSSLRLTCIIARALESNFSHFCDDILFILIKKFMDLDTRAIRPEHFNIMTTVQEIIESIKEEVAKYLASITVFLKIVLQLEIALIGADPAKHLLSILREKCLTIYIAIINGLEKNASNAEDDYLFKTYLDDVLSLVERVTEDDNSSSSCLTSAVKVTSFLKQVYGTKVECLWDPEVITRLKNREKVIQKQQYPNNE